MKLFRDITLLSEFAFFRILICFAIGVWVPLRRTGIVSSCNQFVQPCEPADGFCLVNLQTSLCLTMHDFRQGSKDFFRE